MYGSHHGHSVIAKRETTKKKKIQFQKAVHDTYSEPKNCFRFCSNWYWWLRTFQFGLCYQLDDTEEPVSPPIQPRQQQSNLSDLEIQTGYSKDRLRLWYRIFKETCPSGSANLKDFCEIFAKCFPSTNSKPYAKKIFSAIDTLNSGEITFQDIAISLSEVEHGDFDTRIAWIFKLIDGTGRGSVNFAEAASYIQSIYDITDSSDNPEAPFCNNADVQNRARLTFQKFDLNRDGLITFDEFYTVCNSDENVKESLNTVLSPYTCSTNPH